LGYASIHTYIEGFKIKLGLICTSGKTLRGRLSHIRYKNQQKSSFSYSEGFFNCLYEEVDYIVFYTADAFSTPENTNKVITLATNIKDPLMYNFFEIIDGEDANKFTLKGDERICDRRALNVFPVLGCQ
jgi:hypothetical protein